MIAEIRSCRRQYGMLVGASASSGNAKESVLPPVAKPMPGKALLALRFWPVEEGEAAPNLLGYPPAPCRGR
jgi:hypothetical protein